MYMYVMHVKDRGKCSNIFILLTPITYDMNVKWGGGMLTKFYRRTFYINNVVFGIRRVSTLTNSLGFVFN